MATYEGWVVIYCRRIELLPALTKRHLASFCLSKMLDHERQRGDKLRLPGLERQREQQQAKGHSREQEG